MTWGLGTILFMTLVEELLGPEEFRAGFESGRTPYSGRGQLQFDATFHQPFHRSVPDDSPVQTP